MTCHWKVNYVNCFGVLDRYRADRGLKAAIWNSLTTPVHPAILLPLILICMNSRTSMFEVFASHYAVFLKTKLIV